MPKTIGIMGGMGPAATVDLMSRIISMTDASSDQEHIPMIVDNDTRIPDRTEAILGRGESPAPEMLASARRLEAAGADFIVIACHAAHSFVDEIAQARLDGTYRKLIAKLNRNDLVVLDDFGLQPMNPDTRLALFQLLEERYGEKSVIIASQLPLDKWYSYLTDSTTADAIMDRVVNNSTIINLTGDSMRGRKKRR